MAEQLRPLLEELILACRRVEPSLPQGIRRELIRAFLSSAIQALKPRLGLMSSELRGELLSILLRSEISLKEETFR